MDNPLWQYALRQYALPGVEALCLELQDGHGVDVNLLLCAAWLAADGRRIDGPQLAALRAGIEPWQRDVVTPLRALRRQWRRVAGADELRESLKGIELRAERVLHDRLLAHSVALGPPGPPVHPADNIGQVLRDAGLEDARAETVANELAALLDCAAPGR